MDKKKSVKAVFQGPNKLKVVTTFKNEATGTVTSGDGLISCPGDCEELYILIAPVTLTASPGPGSTFVKWTGNPCKDELRATPEPWVSTNMLLSSSSEKRW
jgi:hypothetical protein